MASPHPPTFGSGVASSKVDISVSCVNLKDLDYFSKSDPCVFLFEYHNRNWSKVGRTEVIDNNLNPEVSLRSAAHWPALHVARQFLRVEHTFSRLLCHVAHLIFPSVVQQKVSAPLSFRRDSEAQVCGGGC